MEVSEKVATDIIRDVMKESGINQTQLAGKLGYSSPSAIASRLSGTNISIERFVVYLKEMGYEVIVRKKDVEGEGKGREWVVAPGRRMHDLYG